MAQMGAIRTLLEAGVFHAIPTGGQSVTSEEISAKTGLDKEILSRYTTYSTCTVCCEAAESLTSQNSPSDAFSHPVGTVP